MKQLLGLSLLLVACQSVPVEPGPDERALPVDGHSFARPNEVRMQHVDLDLELDFEQAVARGTVRLELLRLDPEAPLVLDTMGLTIHAVTGSDGSPRTFHLGETVERFGAPLTIDLQGADDAVTVAYETGPGSKALQWLSPAQTAGGEHPFLFTQGQAILTRTWIPLQDTPGARVTYEARIRCPEPLVAVMSAVQRGRDADGAYRFALEQPIPCYLIALACGDLTSKAISERCAVWAEPPLLEAAHHEFADTERMIQIAEGMFGPYRWGRYDMIVLPPAFPYGGMENPLLTFLTPTVIAGDRSLTSLVAHELAHSWSGNLVTNATWRDFWLNEGSTVYFENRIVEEVYGLDRAHMERALALDDLREDVEGMEPWETVLHVDLDGKHPDDGFSSIPYDKGALFLHRMELAVGRPAFDAFLRKWFDEHAFQGVTTADFHAFLEDELLSRHPEGRAVDVDAWLYRPGLPADAPEVASDAFAHVERELARWAAGTPAASLDTDAWVTQQWLHFLGQLPDPLGPQRMGELDRAFGFTTTGNNEILCAWLVRSIREDYAAAEPRLEQFLMTVGRRKFLQPLYTELVRTDAGRERARTIYAAARPRYHAVSTGTLDAIVTP